MTADPGEGDGGAPARGARPARAAASAAGARLRSGRRRGAERVRSRVRLIAQTAVAAGVAWELATLLQPRPYFAPVAAIISLGVSTGQHLRRAVELSFGVAVGILVADALVNVVGTNAATIALVVILAMSSALLFGAGQILVNQAAVSGVLLATLGTPPHTSSFTRFFSALIGGGVAVVISTVFAREPLEQVGGAAETLLAELADIIEAVAAAFEHGDEAAADAALQAARDADVDRFEDAVALARDALRLTRRRDLSRLAVYEDAVAQVDLAVRNTRVLARTTQTAAVRGVPGDPDLAEALHHLADAVRALGQHLRAPEQHSGARELATRAALEATAVLDHRRDLAANLIVGQIRATAGDLLRGTGLSTTEMRAALGPYPGAP